MPYVNVHSVHLYYEEYGAGPAVILTPGGRVDRNGLRPIAALLSRKCRVIIHDRRNCGRSDVVIGGELSEQHLWAEEMAASSCRLAPPRRMLRRLSGFTPR
jgi:pimeloyl-ACP methyl ester carboxylesterase